MVAVQCYCRGLQIRQHLLDMVEQKQNRRIKQCFDADVVWLDGVKLDLPELLFLNKNE